MSDKEFETLLNLIEATTKTLSKRIAELEEKVEKLEEQGLRRRPC